MRFAIVLLAAAFCSATAATPLKPEVKAEIANGTKDTCIGGQAREPANQDITVAELQDYCACYGDGVAGALQAEDIEKNKAGLTPEVQKAVDALSHQCANKVFK